LSILLTVAALVLVTVLPSAQVTLNSNTSSTNTLDSVWLALREYVAANGVLPCPADASLAIGASNYGVAAANAGTSNNCSGGTPAANYVDTTNHVAIGMVPVRALQLPASAALDAFGRDITYAVDTHATSCWGTTSLTGQIAVSDNGSNNYTIAALVSHGADGHGAWLPMTGSSGTALRLNTGSGDNDQHFVNAHGTGSSSSPTFPSNYSTITSLVTDAAGITTTFVKKPPTSTFDDLVVYNNPQFNMNKLPVSYSANMSTPTVSPPANGVYVGGQYLYFTLTFNTPVTVVSGTPRLDLTAIGTSTSIGGGSIGYATYYGGSGGDTLTFRYYVLNSDSAPNGITLAPSIDLNGAVLSPCPLPFSSPNLSGVILGLYIYVTDTENNMMVKFRADGTFITQWGSQGSGNGKMSRPEDAAVDSSGNIWEVDYSNNRLQEFTNTGTYENKFGSNGTGNGKFKGPYAAVFDSSGNFWVSDNGNDRVEEFNSSGTYVSKFGSYGSGNGQFGYVYQVAIDSSNNLYVADPQNGRIQIFNSSGVWQSNLTGTGNNAMNYPEGVAVDKSGNIWVADSGYNRLQKYSSAGVLLLTVPAACANTTTCASGSGNGEFSFADPTSIHVDPAGNLWVPDTNNYRVQEISTNGTWLMTLGGGTSCTSCTSTTSCTCSWGDSGGTFGWPTGSLAVGR
jgi:sugar lactone lactonase YvrE